MHSLRNSETTIPLALALLGLALMTGCGGEAGTGPVGGGSNSSIASVSIEPGGRAVFVTGELRLSARARDRDGGWIPGTAFTWTSSAPGVASISGSGLVTGLAEGTTTITAQAGGRSGTAQVTVTALDPVVLADPISTATLVSLDWNRSQQTITFAGYEVFRSTQPGVTRQSTSLGVILNSGTTAFIDRTVESGQTYYYRVFESARDSASLGSNEVAVSVTPAIELNAVGADMALDLPRDRMYVSLPILNEIAVVSLSTNQVVDRRFVGSQPQGIDLSDDGSTLYVALMGAASVVAMDTETFSRTEIVVGDSLGHNDAWDVVEGAPGLVFASANPSSGGFAWIVRIDRNNGNRHWRVASNRIIRASPEFQKSPDRKTLYVGEGFSPNSLYRLDIQDPLAPIVLEDDHGSVSGTRRMSINPAGTRIYTRTGQVLRTGSLLQAGRIGSGTPAVSVDGTRVFVGTCFRDLVPDTCTLETYDTATFLIEAAVAVDAPDPNRIIPFPDGTGAWVLSGDILYPVTVP